MQVGDIVFYKAGINTGIGNFISDRAITLWTNGPYIHVDIVTEQLPAGVWRTLGAHTQGIVFSSISPLTDASKYVVAPIAPIAHDAHLRKDALQWALSMQGAAYGWLDIADQVIDRFFPGNTLHLFNSGQMDCSDFAAYYLDKAGVQFPKTMQQPYSVSPNALARFLKLPMSP